MKKILTALCALVVLSACTSDRLEFKDGKFKIAQFTDIHCGWDGLSPVDFSSVVADAVETERPDLLVLTGDVVSGAESLDHAKETWKQICDILEGTGIPYAITLGNHDAESTPGITAEMIFSWIRTYGPHCINVDGAKGIHGQGNKALPVYGRDGKPAAVVYVIDSNDYAVDREVSWYDWIHFDQIRWYVDESSKFTAANGGAPLPSLAYFHICVPEYEIVAHDPARFGSYCEPTCPADINSGFFTAAYEQDDIMGMFVGHDHTNDYCGLYKGIALCYGRQSGMAHFDPPTPSGARIVVLTEGERDFDTWTTSRRDRDGFWSFSGRIKDDQQYFFLNDAWFNYNYETIHDTFGDQKGNHLYVGNAILTYILSQPLEEVQAGLAEHFRLSEKYNVPVLVELDPITFWDSVPELWNWWDPSAPGYDPSNRENVEWSDWGSENAVKIGWLDWGRQIRLKPMANLFSPAYLAVVEDRMTKLIDQTAEWYQSLPDDKKYLLGGVKIIGELGFGINNWYYPDGNSYYDKPIEDDPTCGIDLYKMPDHGAGQIGYAALTYSGIRTSGEITADDIYELEKRYTSVIAEMCAGRGIPRDRLFTHSGGAGRDLAACVQPTTCPSWSFYDKDAFDPSRAPHLENLADSDAPYWAISEWSIFDTVEKEKWYEALSEAYSIQGLRYVSLFNYGTLFDPSRPDVQSAGVAAIRDLLIDLR